MIDLDISFDKRPWEVFLEGKTAGAHVSAATLLALLEEESEETAEEVFLLVDQKGIVLDISDLPKPVISGEAAVRLRQEEQIAARGMNAKDLEKNDPLRLYLEELAGTPAFGDENMLALECAAGNERAMEQLTTLGISRVIELAGLYVGKGVLLLDLIQEGSLGLWQAISNYRDGVYGVYRDRWIHNAMAKAVALQARNSGISQKMRTAMEDYRQIDERLLTEFGRNPTIEEIALELHMSLEETETVRKMLEDARLIQQAKQEQAPVEQNDPEEDRAVEDTAYFQARQRIMELLSTLSEEDARLITLRYGLEKGRPLTPEETGRVLGLTPDEVIAREAAAMALLRKQK